MREVIAEFQLITLSSTDQLTLIPDWQQKQRADIRLIDGSRLIAYEYVYFDTGRTKYSYQWMNADDQLIIRSDNAHDYPDLETSPHHQHVGSEENVQPSEPMTLQKVLEYIAGHISPQ